MVASSASDDVVGQPATTNLLAGSLLVAEAVGSDDGLAQGTTVTPARTEISVDAPAARMFVFDAGVDLNDIVRAVNQVGAAPGDLVAILEALRQAGSLRAELVVI